MPEIYYDGPHNRSNLKTTLDVTHPNSRNFKLLTSNAMPYVRSATVTVTVAIYDNYIDNDDDTIMIMMHVATSPFNNFNNQFRTLNHNTATNGVTVSTNIWTAF